jgi:opacity protein-like surface antigen
MLAPAAPCAAQSFGIGGRLAMVKTESVVEGGDDESVRFTGGQLRMRPSPRMGLEVALDRHSETFTALNEKVVDYPLQASLLLFPVSGAFSPYVLGGPGWYTHKVESLDSSVESVSTRKFGWHAGFGAEILLGRHAGIHADYRYTFLKFGDDDDEEGSGATPRNSFVNSLLPSHEGSMWTAGITIYF